MPEARHKAPPRISQRHHDPSQICSHSFFGAYFAVQLAGKNFAHKGEYFPVFSWSLFSIVKNDVHDVVVEVTRVGDEIYSPPRNYYSLGEIFPAAQRRDSGVLKAARFLTVSRSDPERFAEREQEFIASFFQVDEEVDFQIMVIRFDPLERWHTGHVTERHFSTAHSTADQS
ncbi:MAG: hypothetical protein AAFQ79_17785 [Pseudomonadota bacterium]